MARPDSTSQARSPPVSWAQVPLGARPGTTIPQANTQHHPGPQGSGQMGGDGLDADFGQSP